MCVHVHTDTGNLSRYNRAQNLYFLKSEIDYFPNPHPPLTIQHRSHTIALQSILLTTNTPPLSHWMVRFGNCVVAATNNTTPSSIKQPTTNNTTP